MAAIVNPGNPSTNVTIVKFNFHGKRNVTKNYFYPHLQEHTLHQQFEFMCGFADPQYWQTLKWTIDKEPTQQHHAPCGFKKWQKVVRQIFVAALKQQARKYHTEVVIDLDIEHPEPNMDIEHPEWMQKRWLKYMSKKDTLLALTQSFNHVISRQYAVDLFQSMLKDWKINRPHHDHTQINDT